ncbi:uncharacterized protein YxzL [Bacillus subtilis]|nr:hypothetical protein BGM23_01910 [Bacillus sp. FJAT-14266]AOL33046.1 hypothetical protein BGM20_13940 [Alkalicoccobacillus gibsonii]KKJ81546.1 uncharacterized protein YxzL [Bacillus subtilis]QCY76813.1 hypothetical protein CAH07_00905 [Bacillus subtilis]
MDKVFITYANVETEVIEEGETAKELNYEGEDMQATSSAQNRQTSV